MKRLESVLAEDKIYSISSSNKFLREGCIKGKFHKTPFRNKESSVSDLLELVHSNVCDKIEFSLGGNCYFITFTGDKSRFIHSMFMKHKSETFCREEENLVFCFGALFNSTLNFTQSGWHILFSPDLHFRLAKRVSGQTHSLRFETATRTNVSLVAPA